MRNRFKFVAWIIVVAAPGCLFHGGYPNGYYNNGYYGTPQPQYGYPTGPGSAPYYTPGAPTFQPGGGSNPTPINGGSPTNSGDPNSNGQPGNAPNWNNSAPNNTYDNNNGGSNSAPKFDPNGVGVPDPADEPVGTRPPSTQRPTGLTPTSGASTRSRRNNDQSQVFDQEDQRQRPASFDNEEVVEAEGAYEQPIIRQASGSDDNDFQETKRVPRTSQTSAKPYGHDPQFRWLKGVVEYDENSQIWVIMYDDNPKPSDQLGGELMLGNHKSLGQLQSGDKVIIEGMFDDSETDSRGKPVYQIQRLQKQ